MADTEDSAAPHLCPRCGSPMVQRRAEKGPRKGGFFWGCSRYPACRITIDISRVEATGDLFTQLPVAVRKYPLVAAGKYPPLD